MTDNLLPCPNPWGQDLDSHKIHLELNDDGLWCWACSCGIQGPKRLTQSKATEAWNRRAHMDMGNLQRSEVVHANMILYRIAKLSPAQVAHLYTDGECAEIVAEIRRQRPEAVKPAQPDTRLVEAAVKADRLLRALEPTIADVALEEVADTLRLIKAIADKWGETNPDFERFSQIYILAESTLIQLGEPTTFDAAALRAQQEGK